MLHRFLGAVLLISLAIIIFNNLGQMLNLFGQPLGLADALLLLLISALFAVMFIAAKHLANVPHPL